MPTYGTQSQIQEVFKLSGWLGGVILEAMTSLSDIVGLKNQQAQKGLKPGIRRIFAHITSTGLLFGQESL